MLDPSVWHHLKAAVDLCLICRGKSTIQYILHIRCNCRVRQFHAKNVSPHTNTTTPQAAYKLYVFIAARHRLRAATVQLYDFHVRCSRDRQTAALCHRWTRRFYRFAVIYAAVTVGAVLTFIMAPLGIYAVTGQRDVPVLPTHFPGIDARTPNGYRLLYAVHAVSIAVGTTVLFCSDLTVYLLALHVCPMAEVLALELAVFERSLKRGIERGRDWRTIIGIVGLHQEMGRYLTELARMLAVLFMIDVLMAGMSMCMALFAWLQLKWIPLGGLFVAYLVKLFVTCTMGTLVDIYVST